MVLNKMDILDEENGHLEQSAKLTLEQAKVCQRYPFTWEMRNCKDVTLQKQSEMDYHMLKMMWNDHHINPIGTEFTRGYMPGLGLQNENNTKLSYFGMISRCKELKACMEENEAMMNNPGKYRNMTP